MKFSDKLLKLTQGKIKRLLPLCEIMDMKTDSLNLVEAKLNLLKRVLEGQFVKRETIEQTRNTE